MRLDEFLVKELKPEHRDREWVDNDGTHWAWLEGGWAYQWVSGPDRGWGALEDAHWIDFPSRGPFMEAMHHRATR